MLDKKTVKKNTNKSYKNRSGGVGSSNATKNGGINVGRLKTSNNNIADNSSTKRKTGLAKRYSSALPSVGEINEISS